MSNLTIDQILAERRMDENPDIYGIEKEASSQPVNSSQFSYEEVEKMASILENADIQVDNNSGGDLNEKIAAALILSDSINALYKEASDSEPKEEEKEEKEEEKSEEEKTAMAKVASFIVNAHESGVSDEELAEFIEKKAKAGSGFFSGLKGLLTSKPGKAAIGAGALGGAAYGGKEYGEHETEEKAKRILPKILRLGQAQGYRMGTRKGFEAGAHAANSAWKQRLLDRAKQG
jgi:hypothetical protein